jgi:hypothetical protein
MWVGIALYFYAGQGSGMASDRQSESQNQAKLRKNKDCIGSYGRELRIEGKAGK